LGFIDYNGKLEIHSSLLSVVLHDQPQVKGKKKPNGSREAKARVRP